MVPRHSGFVIIIIISSTLGATAGLFACYLFSNLNPVFLKITLGFGLLFVGSLVWVYHYFRKLAKHNGG